MEGPWVLQSRNVACERMIQACMFTKGFLGLSHLG